ncbi:MAG: hypothetical protein JW809_10485 [Pirellulales bacterium]|nr:hypothetical protein [Pirellulales bacterium]
MNHRTRFTLWTILFLFSAAFATAATAATVEEMKEARKKLAWKPRGVIWNNDGNDAITEDEPSRENFLRTRAVPVMKTKVDTVCYCSGVWGVFKFPSPVAELRDSRDRGRPEWAAHLGQDGGPDALATMVDYTHQHGKEFFWSLRMNDTHDAADATMLSRWKKAHREFLVGKPRVRYPSGARRWSAADYAHEEVRDRVALWIDDVARRYDVDGFELDFFRHAIFFQPQLLGKPVTQEQCDRMTSLMTRLRQMTDELGAKRGRPFLIAIRVPDSAGFCKAIGLDVERWMSEGLVDMLITTGYFRLNPWETSVELGHRHHVPVYASLDEPRLRGQEELQKLRESIECYRARALAAWRAGVDGIYLFNYYFHPDMPACNDLGDPDALMRMDKLYTTGAREIRGARSYLVNAGEFINRPPMLPEKPAALAVAKPAEVTLDVFDKLAENGGTATARLYIPGLSGLENLTVTLNGQALAQGKPTGPWIEYAVEPSLVKTGANRFAVSVKKPEKKGVVLRDLVLSVRYPRKP